MLRVQKKRYKTFLYPDIGVKNGGKITVEPCLIEKNHDLDIQMNIPFDQGSHDDF